MKKIEALIFDVGGVLFLPKNYNEKQHILSSFTALYLLLKDFGLIGSQRIIFDIYTRSSKGEISKEDTSRLISNEVNVSQEKLENVINQIYSDNTIENKELYDWILKLRNKGYKTGILSTQFHLSKNILIPEKYYQNFDALEISCDDKLKKPDKRVFKSILSKLSVEPEKSIFIDDKQGNLDAAEKIGMKTAVFDNNEQFFSCIKKAGIQ